MCNWPEARAQRRGLRLGLAGATLALVSAAPLASGPGPAAYAGIGRTATAQEVAAWDTDVRPDFKGLPPGAGSVAQGQGVWEAACASCHGTFGESNEVFAPLVGGTTRDDMVRGRVARLLDPAYTGRTTLMKLSSLSTLWDYIRRAMPWNQPKSLRTDEVYAVTAYLLNLGSVVDDDFVLSNTNMAEVQKRLPNRDGGTTDHGLWPGQGMGNGGRPDVQGADCMTACSSAPQIASVLPDFARDHHGQLADQQRRIGPQRGANTLRPAPASLAETVAAAALTAVTAADARGTPGDGTTPAAALARQHACTACHGSDRRGIGPAFREIAARHAGRSDLESYLAGKIRSGGQGLWGPTPMPPQALPEADARAIAQWLAAGATP